MANTLRFKRGLVAGIPTGVAGEPLFTTDTFDLYIGNGTTNTRFQKYIASGTTAQYLRGDGSLATFPTNIVTGTGTTNYLPKFTGASTLGNSSVFDNGTNVGIGTASPSAGTKLQVDGAVFVNRSGNVNYVLNSASSHYGFIQNDAGNKWSLSSGTSLTSGLGTSALTWFSTGNVSIGNLSDNGLRFQVTGDGSFSGYVTATNATLNCGNTTGLNFKFSASYGNTGLALNWDSITDANNQLKFLVNNAAGTGVERMILNGAGNLGLGVVPSATTTYKNIQNGFAVMMGSTADFSAYWNANAVWNSGWKYIGTAAAFRYEQTSGHAWFNAPSGTAGNAITFTQAMTLTAVGRLILGAGDTGELLQVNGTMKVTGASTFGGDLSVLSSASRKLTIGGTNSGAYGELQLGDGTTNNAYYVTTQVGGANDGLLIKRNTTTFLLFSNTGAATFSSSVTAATATIGTAATTGYTLTVGNSGANDLTGIRLTNGGTDNGYFITAYNGVSKYASLQAGDNDAYRSIVMNNLGGNVGIGMNAPSYKLDVTGEARVSSAIAIGTTPDTNKPFKILKNINATVGINFENTSTSSLAFSAIQMGTDVTGGTKFTNLVYGSSGISEAGVYKPSGTSLVNTGAGGLNFLAVSQPIRFFTSSGNGTLRAEIANDGFINHFTGTAPSTNATDGYRQYSADVVAGNAAPHFRTENGAVIKIYQETTGVGNAIFSAGGGTGVLDDSTFDGYTLRQIVKALRNQGILA